MTDMTRLVVDTIRALARDLVVPANLADAPLDAETPLRELAIDSIGTLGVLSELEVRSGRLLDERLLHGCVTIGDLASALERS